MLGFSTERSKQSSERFPAASSLGSRTRATPARSDGSKPQPPLCRVLTTLSPATEAGTKVRGSQEGSGNTPPGHPGRSDSARFPEPELHTPIPGETPGLSPCPEGPAVWLLGAALELALHGMQKTRIATAAPPAPFPHSPPRASPSRSPTGT